MAPLCADADAGAGAGSEESRKGKAPGKSVPEEVEVKVEVGPVWFPDAAAPFSALGEDAPAPSPSCACASSAILYRHTGQVAFVLSHGTCSVYARAGKKNPDDQQEVVMRRFVNQEELLYRETGGNAPNNLHDRYAHMAC